MKANTRILPLVAALMIENSSSQLAYSQTRPYSLKANKKPRLAVTINGIRYSKAPMNCGGISPSNLNDTAKK